jgi:hypothetical protein
VHMKDEEADTGSAARGWRLWWWDAASGATAAPAEGTDAPRVL